jgi:hypothetical protein
MLLLKKLEKKLSARRPSSGFLSTVHRAWKAIDIPKCSDQFPKSGLLHNGDGDGNALPSRAGGNF